VGVAYDGRTQRPGQLWAARGCKKERLGPGQAWAKEKECSHCLHITKNIAYHITEVLIFHADKLMVMGNSKNLHVFNFTILLKSQKFDAREIYTFYNNFCLN